MQYLAQNSPTSQNWQNWKVVWSCTRIYKQTQWINYSDAISILQLPYFDRKLHTCQHRMLRFVKGANNSRAKDREGIRRAKWSPPCHCYCTVLLLLLGRLLADHNRTAITHHLIFVFFVSLHFHFSSSEHWIISLAWIVIGCLSKKGSLKTKNSSIGTVLQACKAPKSCSQLVPFSEVAPTVLLQHNPPL